MVRTPSFDDKSGMKKGSWTPEEDKKLIAYVTRYGCWNWRQLPRFAGLARCGKSCRLRWLNYLRPDIKRGDYTEEEEEVIVQLHQKLGSRWSVIAANLPGRTDNDIKNHWTSTLKKRFIFQSKKTQQTDSVSHNIQDTEEDSLEQSNNIIISTFSKATPQNTSRSSSAPLSPSSEFSTSATDSSSSSSNEDFFHFVNNNEEEDIWSESFLAELMQDNNGDVVTLQGSDSYSSSECSVLQPAVENSWVEQCVADDIPHVPNELSAHQSDHFFCPVYHDLEFWKHRNLYDDDDIGIGLF